MIGVFSPLKSFVLRVMLNESDLQLCAVPLNTKFMIAAESAVHRRLVSNMH